MVGDELVLDCVVTTVSGVEPSAVIFSWTGPRGAISNGIGIDNSTTTTTITTTSNDNTHTSSLQFMYLMEGDNGTYTCNVSILDTNGTVSVELGPLNGKVLYITYTTLSQIVLCIFFGVHVGGLSLSV